MGNYRSPPKSYEELAHFANGCRSFWFDDGEAYLGSDFAVFRLMPDCSLYQVSVLLPMSDGFAQCSRDRVLDEAWRLTHGDTPRPPLALSYP